MAGAGSGRDGRAGGGKEARDRPRRHIGGDELKSNYMLLPLGKLGTNEGGDWGPMQILMMVSEKPVEETFAQEYYLVNISQFYDGKTLKTIPASKF